MIEKGQGSIKGNRIFCAVIYEKKEMVLVI